MNDRVFLDSNILVYAYSKNEPEKQIISRRLISENQTFISTLVLQELVNVLTKKFKVGYAVASVAVEECSQNNELSINTKTTIFKACTIAERYGFSFYDSLIVASAIENHCSVLYSEDLQNGQLIEDKITIINPYK